MDFCDAIECTPDVPAVGYQGSHSGGLPILVHSNGSSSSILGSSSFTHGGDFSSTSVPLNPPTAITVVVESFPLPLRTLAKQNLQLCNTIEDAVAKIKVSIFFVN